MMNFLIKIKSALFSKNEGSEQIDDIITEDEKERGFDEVNMANLSNDLNQMLSATEIMTTPKHRHHLLQGIVTETYKLRKEEKYKDMCLKFSAKHLEEFSEIAPHLIDKYNPDLPRVLTFQYYATLLSEIGEYDEAIKVCEKAIEYGLNDGTKGGYISRIEKINKLKLINL